MRVASVVLSFLLMSLMAVPTMAATMYVNDQLIVTVRTGPSTRNKILQSLKTGAAVEVLSEEGEYLFVRTGKGIEGYTLKQYYSSEIPKAQQIARLQRERTQLTRKIAQMEEQQAQAGQQLTERNQLLQTEKGRMSQLQKALEAEQAEKVRVQSQYDQLQRDAGQVIQITEERNRLKEQTQLLTDRLSTVQEENQDLMRQGAINWFLAGGGVFLVGWIVGKMSRKRRSGF